jgi:hypothetical protein
VRVPKRSSFTADRGQVLAENIMPSAVGTSMMISLSRGLAWVLDHWT